MDPHAPDRCGVGMVGYAFMGAAHSQAWRTAPHFFDLPLHPADAGAVRPGRRPGRRGRRPARLGVDRDRLDPAARPRRHRPGRHLHPRRHPRRDRHRRARGRQARALREAARQHRRRGARRWRRPPSGPPSTASGPWSGSPTAACPAVALARRAGRGGPDRRDPARAGAVPPGLARRPVGADDLAAGEGQGRLRRARRHRGAHRRPHPVHHRRPDRHRQRAARDLRAPSARWRTGGRRAARRAARTAPAEETGRGDRRRHGGVPRAVRRRSRRGLRGHPVRHRPQERHPDRDQRLDGQPRLRLRGHERPASSSTPRSRRRPPASAASWSPSPSTPTSGTGGRPATGWATSTASPTRWSTW